MTPRPHSFAEVFAAFGRLGLTSFGGPVAHLGFFHGEFVERRRWLDENEFADLVALCQFLPGPASSQVGMALGLNRAGLPGLLAAWLGFTLPSALLMIGFAYGVEAMGDVSRAGWVKGLKLAAVAVVAQAVWTMATKLCPDRPRTTLALLAAVGVLTWPSAGGQIVMIAGGAVAGWILFRQGMDPNALLPGPETRSPVRHGPSRPLGAAALGLFFALLSGLPLWAAARPERMMLGVFSGFYRAASLVFGGGHVVLPLLKAETVDKGWVTADRFLAGYGAAQALPGPLFTFAGYLGASLTAPRTGGWVGGTICLTAIFLPSALLIAGVLPFWDALRRRPAAQAALRGTNAAVVGVLLAAFYDPVWTSAVHNAREFSLALAVFGLLMFWHFPPWLVVALAAVTGKLCF